MELWRPLVQRHYVCAEPTNYQVQAGAGADRLGQAGPVDGHLTVQIVAAGIVRQQMACSMEVK